MKILGCRILECTRPEITYQEIKTTDGYMAGAGHWEAIEVKIESTDENDAAISNQMQAQFAMMDKPLDSTINYKFDFNFDTEWEVYGAFIINVAYPIGVTDRYSNIISLTIRYDNAIMVPTEKAA